MIVMMICNYEEGKVAFDKKLVLKIGFTIISNTFLHYYDYDEIDMMMHMKIMIILMRIKWIVKLRN